MTIFVHVEIHLLAGYPAIFVHVLPDGRMRFCPDCSVVTLWIFYVDILADIIYPPSDGSFFGHKHLCECFVALPTALFTEAVYVCQQDLFAKPKARQIQDVVRNL